jgi:hypothetical protein
VAFDGNNSDLVPFFSGLGHVCPANYNPADFVLLLLQTLPEDGLRAVFNLASSRVALAPAVSSVNHSARTARRKAKPGFLRQLWWLAQRELRDVVRDRPALGARFGMTIFLNVLFGLMFMNAGRWQEDDPEDSASALQTHLGALTQFAIGCMFGAVQV